MNSSHISVLKHVLLVSPLASLDSAFFSVTVVGILMCYLALTCGVMCVSLGISFLTTGACAVFSVSTDSMELDFHTQKAFLHVPVLAILNFRCGRGVYGRAMVELAHFLGQRVILMLCFFNSGLKGSSTSAALGVGRVNS